MVIRDQPSWSSCSPLQPTEANQIVVAPQSSLRMYAKHWRPLTRDTEVVTVQQGRNQKGWRLPEGLNIKTNVQQFTAGLFQRTLLLESHRVTKTQIPKVSLQHNLLLKSISLQDIPTEFYVNILFCLSSWDKNITFWVNILSMIHMRTSIHFTLLNSLLTLFFHIRQQ